VKMKRFDLALTEVFDDLNVINQCYNYAIAKTPSANQKLFRGDKIRPTDRIFNDQYWGKICECCAQKQLAKTGTHTKVDFEIYKDNQDRGDLHTPSKVQYEVKGSKHKSHNYLLTHDKYGQDILPNADYHVAVRWIEVNGMIRYDAGIITRDTFNKEHEILRAGKLIPWTNTALEVDNWCVELKYFDLLM
jgi:hypothetical protein